MIRLTLASSSSATRSSRMATTAVFVFEFLHPIPIINTRPTTSCSRHLPGRFRQLKLKVILLNSFVSLGLSHSIPLRTTNTSYTFLRCCFDLWLLIKLLHISLPADILRLFLQCWLLLRAYGQLLLLCRTCTTSSWL